MKLRGDQVAVLLADHRMPQMDGIQFLEKAMDIYPKARRVLLTAYADTDAAITAINVVDLDYYLLKPWDPPEEKFYPVIDAQLDHGRSDRPPRGVADQADRPPLVGPLAARSRTSWPATRCRTCPTCPTRSEGETAAGRGAAWTTPSCRW